MKSRYFVGAAVDFYTGESYAFRCYRRKYWPDPEEYPEYWSDEGEIWNGDDLAEGRRIAREENAKPRGER
jgi:hypothetical protein